MKIWSHLSVVRILILVVKWTLVGSQFNNDLEANAQNLDDLVHVFGPNFRVFVAVYWRFLISSCELVRYKMSEDLENGRLEKFCPFLYQCPNFYETQSCMVQTSVVNIRLACCQEMRFGPAIQPVALTESPEQPRQPSTVGPPTRFSKEAQSTCNYARAMPTAKIFGGSQARRGEFPWIAMLLRNGIFICGCTVLDDSHVMTAAHCFDTHRDNYNYEVIAGKYTSNLSVVDIGQQRVSVTSFVQHEDYQQRLSRNDLAIVELATPLKWSSYVMPACLPRSDDTLETYCTVAGWGKTDGFENATVLMKVELQAYTQEQCLETFRDTADEPFTSYLAEGSICAANGLLGRKDACKGDSGGPLMCIKRTETSSAYFVFGVVSNGNNCAIPGEPGLYTNVQYYLTWIEKTILTLY